jgi:ABC-type amino acid transport substrate-binding protein
VLKVAIRSDSPIFGYIDDNRQWTGYCFDVVEAIETSLEAMEAMPSDIEVHYVPSNLGNRYELVQSGFVALECGPNTIRTDVEGVAFSVPFFYTGTQLLVPQDDAALLATNPTLAGTSVGVAAQTTNEAFLRQGFPEANLITFESSLGGTVGLQGLSDGSFAAYASDSVLLRAALADSGWPESEYQLIPAQPLTCDSYGLILPTDDEEWQRTIGTLLQREPQLSIQETWLGEYYPLELATLEYCLGVERPVIPPLN